MGRGGVRKYPANAICAFPDCDKLRRKREWCSTHWKRWHKHGDPAIVLYQYGDDITSYITAHSRLRRLRGPASAHLCVDCGKPARHWSLPHDAPNQKVGLSNKGKPTRFSPDPFVYVPRDSSCHKRYDLGR